MVGMIKAVSGIWNARVGQAVSGSMSNVYDRELSRLQRGEPMQVLERQIEAPTFGRK